MLSLNYYHRIPLWGPSSLAPYPSPIAHPSWSTYVEISLPLQNLLQILNNHWWALGTFVVPNIPFIFTFSIFTWSSANITCKNPISLASYTLFLVLCRDHWPSFFLPHNLIIPLFLVCVICQVHLFWRLSPIVVMSFY